MASPPVLASETVIRDAEKTNAGGYASCCTDPFADAPLAHVLVLVSVFIVLHLNYWGTWRPQTTWALFIIVAES
jgi:hypothetical protein